MIQNYKGLIPASEKTARVGQNDAQLNIVIASLEQCSAIQSAKQLREVTAECVEVLKTAKLETCEALRKAGHAEQLAEALRELIGKIEVMSGAMSVNYEQGNEECYPEFDVARKVLANWEEKRDLEIIDRIPLDQPMNKEETAALDREVERGDLRDEGRSGGYGESYAERNR